VALRRQSYPGSTNEAVLLLNTTAVGMVAKKYMFKVEVSIS
jgi:hypothetical protein